MCALHLLQLFELLVTFFLLHCISFLQIPSCALLRSWLVFENVFSSTSLLPLLSFLIFNVLLLGIEEVFHPKSLPNFLPTLLPEVLQTSYLICTGRISKGRSAGQVIPPGASVCLPFKCHFSSVLFPLLSIGRKWLQLNQMVQNLALRWNSYNLVCVTEIISR